MLDKNPVLGTALVVLILAAAEPGYCVDQGDPPRPNIVYVLADDLGWNDVGYHGGAVETPVLDGLARDGVQLDRFYVHPMCTPTRVAFMTGKHPFRLGMSLSVIQPWDKVGLPLEETTIAQLVHQQGYFTAIIGKWHLGMHELEYLPTRRGFDYHYGHYGGHLDYFTHQYPGWSPPGRGYDWHRNEEQVREEGYATDLLGSDAARLIREHDFAKPLFLYLPFNAPHSPLQAKPEDIARFDGIDDHKRRIYAAQVYSLDAAIGQVIQALEDRGQWNNTLFVFTSDNGAAVSAHSRGDNRRLKGEKGMLYEGGIRVPALLSWPGIASRGEIVDEPVQIEDLYTTFASVAGIPPAQLPDVDGRDMSTAFKGDGAGSKEILLHLDEISGALLSSPYKLIYNGMRDSKRPWHGRWELYDVVSDPYESKELSRERPDIFRALRHRLEAWQGLLVEPILRGGGRGRFVPPRQWDPAETAAAGPWNWAMLAWGRVSDWAHYGARRWVVVSGFVAGAIVSFALTGLFVAFSARRRRAQERE